MIEYVIIKFFLLVYILLFYILYILTILTSLANEYRNAKLVAKGYV